MIRKKLRIRVWRLLPALLLLAVGYGGWQLWWLLRPPSPARWTAAMRAGREAAKAEQFPAAEKQYQRALCEARKWGSEDERLGQTEFALADCADTANAHRLADLILHETRLPKPIWNIGRRLGPRAKSTLDALDARQLKLHPEQEVTDGYRRALSTYQCAYGANDTRLIPILEHIARYFEAHEAYDQAHALRRQAFEITRYAYGLDDPRTGTAYDRTSDQIQSRPEVFFAAKLRRWEQEYGPDDPRILASLLQLAEAEARDGFADITADRDCRRALALAERAYGKTDQRLVEVLLQAADCYASIRWGEAESCWHWRPKDAERIYMRAVTILSADPKYMVDLAFVYSRTASFLGAIDSSGYSMLGITGEVKQKTFREKARCILETPTCPNNARTVEALSLLAGKYESDNATIAERIWKRALAMSKQLYGPQSRETAAILGEMATFYDLYLDDDRTALRLLRERAAILHAIADNTDPGYLRAMHELAEKVCWTGGYKIYREYLPIVIKGRGISSSEVYGALIRLEESLQSQQKWDEVNAMHQRAIAVGVTDPM